MDDITQEEINKFEQRELDDENRRRYAALHGGSYLTIKDRKIGEHLRMKEKEKEGETKWILIHNSHTGIAHSIEIIRDRCSAANFVTASTVEELGLKTQPISDQQFYHVAGGHFTCHTLATLSWKGKGGEMRDTPFYVIPDESPIKHALVGKDFDDSFGHCLLDNKPREVVAYVAQSPRTRDEEEKVQLMRKKMEDHDSRSKQVKIEHEQRVAARVSRPSSWRSWKISSKKSGDRELVN